MVGVGSPLRLSKQEQFARWKQSVLSCISLPRFEEVLEVI